MICSFMWLCDHSFILKIVYKILYLVINSYEEQFLHLQMFYIYFDIFLQFYLFDNSFIHMVIRSNYLTMCLFILLYHVIISSIH